jgi:hypothetical protein
MYMPQKTGANPLLLVGTLCYVTEDEQFTTRYICTTRRRPVIWEGDRGTEGSGGAPERKGNEVRCSSVAV